MTRKVGTSATWFNWRHKPQALEQSIEGLLGGFSIMSLDLVGSPDVIAAQMAKAMEHNGGNGFLYTHRGQSSGVLTAIRHPASSRAPML
jgi:hypothetical protein